MKCTPWVNSTVVTRKRNGSIRLCLNSRDLKKAIKRNPYYVRTIDAVIPKISGATHFNILDARSGFWQVELDDESSRLWTFNTPWGNTDGGHFLLASPVVETYSKRRWIPPLENWMVWVESLMIPYLWQEWGRTWSTHTWRLGYSKRKQCQVQAR